MGCNKCSRDHSQYCDHCEDRGYNKVICPNCNGSGEGGYDGSTCYVCKGAGEILEPCNCKGEYDE